MVVEALEKSGLEPLVAEDVTPSPKARFVATRVDRRS